MSSDPTTVTAAFVFSVCPDKQSLYEAVLRNQYWLPPAKDSLMSTEFMRGVVDQHYWLPKTSEMKVLNCADMPTKYELVDLLGEKMMNMPSQGEPFDSQFRRTCIKMKEKPPSASWMLVILSSMEPGHDIFKKDWVRTKPVRGGAANARGKI